MLELFEILIEQRLNNETTYIFVTYPTRISVRGILQQS